MVGLVGVVGVEGVEAFVYLDVLIGNVYAKDCYRQRNIYHTRQRACVAVGKWHTVLNMYQLSKHILLCLQYKHLSFGQ